MLTRLQVYELFRHAVALGDVESAKEWKEILEHMVKLGLEEYQA